MLRHALDVHLLLGCAPVCLPCLHDTSAWQPAKVGGRGASFGFHCLANGLVWLSLGTSGDPQQAQLLQEVLRLPKVYPVSPSSCSRLSDMCCEL